MKKYELIYIWYTGVKETAIYNTIEKAIKAEKSLKMAFNNQIIFSCINEKTM